MKNSDVKFLCDELDIKPSVAKELALLADGNLDLAVEASKASWGLGEAKARIIDERFKQIERNSNGTDSEDLCK